MLDVALGIELGAIVGGAAWGGTDDCGDPGGVGDTAAAAHAASTAMTGNNQPTNRMRPIIASSIERSRSRAPLVGRAYELDVTEIKPDERVAEAIEVVEATRDPDSRWTQQNVYPASPVLMDDGEGAPNRWNTIRALQVLDWFGATDSSAFGPFWLGSDRAARAGS